MILAGDLLRAEQKRPGSKYGELINNYIRDGLIVPMEVTITLLENAMKEAMQTSKTTRFLIDGFPRKMDQAIKFEEVVSRKCLFDFCGSSMFTMHARLYHPNSFFILSAQRKSCFSDC